MHGDVPLERVPSFFGQWQVYERRLADDGVNLASGSKSASRSFIEAPTSFRLATISVRAITCTYGRYDLS